MKNATGESVRLHSVIQKERARVSDLLDKKELMDVGGKNIEAGEEQGGVMLRRRDTGR